MSVTTGFTGEIRMLIGGELVEAQSGKRFENLNPATEAVLGDVADAPSTDMQRANRGCPAGVRRVRLVDQPPSSQAVPGAASLSWNRQVRA
jgi:hypothetical protein